MPKRDCFPPNLVFAAYRCKPSHHSRLFNFQLRQPRVRRTDERGTDHRDFHREWRSLGWLLRSVLSGTQRGIGCRRKPRDLRGKMVWCMSRKCFLYSRASNRRLHLHRRSVSLDPRVLINYDNQEAIEGLPSVGDVTVTTGAVVNSTPFSGRTGDVIASSRYVTPSADVSAVLRVGDWIRLCDPADGLVSPCCF